MSSALHPLNVNVVNGRRARVRLGSMAGSLLGFAFACALLIMIVKLVLIVALVVAFGALVVALVRPARRPVTPAVPVARVNDAAARAHRARMAAIRAAGR
jgi:uncharacterized membrane protein